MRCVRRNCWRACAARRAADRVALVDAIVRIGQLAADHPEIAELDVNPLLVLPAGQGAIAVDVRIILS